jgi:hypothetical protein
MILDTSNPSARIGYEDIEDGEDDDQTVAETNHSYWMDESRRDNEIVQTENEEEEEDEVGYESTEEHAYDVYQEYDDYDNSSQTRTNQTLIEYLFSNNSRILPVEVLEEEDDEAGGSDTMNFRRSMSRVSDSSDTSNSTI